MVARLAAGSAAAAAAAAAVARAGLGGQADEAKWEAQLARLAAYKAAHGDCNVPRGWAEDPVLGRWVSDQRAYKKALDRRRGTLHHTPWMTAARASELEALGFVWDPRLIGGRRS
jgi:hypothetical protein